MSTKLGALSPPRTLAEVLQRVAAFDSLAHQRRHDLMSAVRRVARLLDRLPADVPADPETLRHRLSLIHRTSANMTKSRFRNIRALLAAALDLTGAKVMRRRCHVGLVASWAALLKRVGDQYERSRLSRFFSFASENGIDPNAINDRTVADFTENLRRNSLLNHQRRIVRDLCVAWNRCADSIEGWPGSRLTVPNRRRDYVLPASAYPSSFGLDVQAYLAHISGADLFDATGRSPASPATVRGNRVRLFEMAAALVHSGRTPETIRSLADLVTPEALKIALTFFWSRGGKRKTGHIHHFALAALKIAKYWVQAPAEQIEALQAIRRQVVPQRAGMTERNRARLRQFDDHENLTRLIDLPEKILRSSPRSGKFNRPQALRIQSGLAIGILLVAPMRMKNLASLHLDRHFVRTRPGGVRQIVIPREEVKNRVLLSYEIPGRLSKLLDFYLARCRPIFSGDSNGYLFPGRDGHAKTTELLSAQIQNTIVREVGIILNPHAFRHLAAKLFLAAHPGEYKTVSLLLGHTNSNTTETAYSGLELADALRRLDSLIERYRTKPRKKS